MTFPPLDIKWGASNCFPKLHSSYAEPKWSLLLIWTIEDDYDTFHINSFFQKFPIQMDSTPNPTPTPASPFIPGTCHQVLKKIILGQNCKKTSLFPSQPVENLPVRTSSLYHLQQTSRDPSSGCPKGIQTPNLRHQVPAADSQFSMKWVDGQSIKMTA